MSLAKHFRNPYFMFRFLECCLGGVCFGLFAYYFIAVEYLGDSSYMQIVKYGICFVAADGFPFIVQIPFLIAYLHHGRSFQYNILNPIVSLVGAILYLTAGSLCLNSIMDNDFGFSTAYTAEGSMFVCNGWIYLADFSFWMKSLRRSPESNLA